MVSVQPALHPSPQRIRRGRHAVPVAVKIVRANPVEGTQTAAKGQQLLRVSHHQFPERAMDFE
jgi:hypothetical protein